MNTLQTEFAKHRQMLADMRHLGIIENKEHTMQQETVSNSRNTGGKAANKRHKRTSEELNRDVNEVDKLVATGKFNQIEALHKLNLQSSVYHYRKRQMRLAPAKATKKRKFVAKPKKVSISDHVDASFEARKQAVLNSVEQKLDNKVTDENTKLKMELELLVKRCAELEHYVIENCVLNKH